MKQQRNQALRVTLAALTALACAVAFARHHHAKPAAGTPGRFDYYVLTLSWSPTYCLTHPQDRHQCSGKGYGFVLHGLWPQYDSGNWPEFCSTDPLPPDARQLGVSLFPSQNLMEHEWQRHGTCSGLGAIAYFRTADKALAAIHVPSGFEAPRHSLSMTGAQISSAFHAANPSIPADGLSVACGRGELTEVRVCLTRGLTPRSCGKGVRDTCPASPVEVPATRGQ
ncbi:MAG: ribonuclease T2 [Proteobacteria bacterium]|nr:ribonuclease T2 [Pseudomonadota bacterium]